MPDPFVTLGLPDNATDADVRQAYLRMIRRFPPERSPKAFQAISEAYEAAKTEVGRAKIRVFGCIQRHDSLTELLPEFPPERRRVGIDLWLQALKEPHERLQ